jgi:hypothetical protein
LKLDGWTVDEAAMRVRLKRKLSESVNGVDLSRAREGDTLDLSPREALLLIAEGWATPVYDLRRRSERHKAHDRPRKKKGN